jgi:guanylate kinase
LDSLKHRLSNRGTESDERIAARINQAKWEMSLQDKYQHIIVNEHPTTSTNTLRNLIKEEILKHAH